MGLRVGLIGLGRIGRVHLQALSSVSAANVIGVYDLDQALARERADAAAVGRVFASWDELLQDPEVDCVGVLLPHDLHERYVVEALEAGKHVVCEKPLAPTLPECERMLAAASRCGRKLLPVHNRVYTQAVEKRASYFTRTRSAKCSWRKPPASKLHRRFRPGSRHLVAEAAC